MAKVMVGIPCYRDVSAETLEDYMRFMFWCGRRTEHEYVLGIKSKTEQFRARIAIAEGALQTGCDYLFFLDDDHVIDWETTPTPNSRYGIVDRLIGHMESDPSIGIVGAVYYHRGSDCRPVLMKEGNQGGYFWLRDDQITGKLQDVDVQGGGCMLIRCSMFDKIEKPWFEPEHDLGTDIQICRAAKAAGYRVCCDTGVSVGHVMNRREVVTADNRHRIAIEAAGQSYGGGEGLNRQWLTNSAIQLYAMDAMEYLGGVTLDQVAALAMTYKPADIMDWHGDVKGYYASRGNEQLARQVMFHSLDETRREFEMYSQMVNFEVEAYGCDYGCGSAPLGFEFAMKGHRMDFVDIDGAGGYEFTKWRAKHRGIEDRCGWSLRGPYDYVLMMDSIEHIEDWRDVLTRVAGSLKEGGALITNYFNTFDHENPEHISMDHDAVRKHLVDIGVFPMNNILWVRRDLGWMDEAS